jgi:hypothetical protein
MSASLPPLFVRRDTEKRNKSTCFVCNTHRRWKQWNSVLDIQELSKHVHTQEQHIQVIKESQVQLIE